MGNISPEFRCLLDELERFTSCLAKETEGRRGDHQFQRAICVFLFGPCGDNDNLRQPHVYLHGHQRLGILFHVLNALQIIRLLATRGHYSIDIIIAWYVASHISRSAGRLGWYYSRGKTITDWLPNSPRQIFERLAGIEGERRSLRYYRLVEQIQVQEALMDMEELDYMHSESEIMQTAVRLAAESAGSLLHGGNHHSSADVQVSASELEKKAN